MLGHLGRLARSRFVRLGMLSAMALMICWLTGVNGPPERVRESREGRVDRYEMWSAEVQAGPKVRERRPGARSWRVPGVGIPGFDSSGH